MGSVPAIDFTAHPLVPGILVVDDDAEVRDFLRVELEDRGYSVWEACGGRDAVDAIAKRRPALVLTDLEMPHMTGIELVRAIREELELIEMPVVLMSGRVDSRARIDALDAGANDFLPKPLDIEELAARIRAQLRQSALVRQLRSEAITDSLTGLLNRRGTLSALQRELGRCDVGRTPLSVLVIDIDRFKAINDTLGHPAGDRALCDVADALRGAVRASDIVGRIGGDEMVAVLVGASARDAHSVAQRLKQLVADRLIAGTGRTLSVSVGVATAVLGDTNATELLAAADRAMYQDKASAGDPMAMAAVQ